MPLKTITVQGRQWVLGRKVPKSKERTFRTNAQTLIGITIPTPPSTIAVPASCANGLSQTFMNTQLGCCVIAHHAHFLANVTSQVGKPFIYTDKQIIADYSAVGGYIPGDPFSDQGCDIGTDLSYLKSTGFADGSKLLGSIDLDPTSQLAMTQSVWITGGVCFGMSMPNAWINPAPQESGFVWDVAGSPDDGNGHCFTGFAYPTSQGITIATWGMIGTITWAAIAKYGAASANGEVHPYVNPEVIAPRLAWLPAACRLTRFAPILTRWADRWWCLPPQTLPRAPPRAPPPPPPQTPSPSQAPRP